MKELNTIGKELSRHVKTQKDLAEVMGHLSKTMLEIRMPRDRSASFEPAIVPKG